MQCCSREGWGVPGRSVIAFGQRCRSGHGLRDLQIGWYVYEFKHMEVTKGEARKQPDHEELFSRQRFLAAVL